MFCSLACSTGHRNHLDRISKIEKYSLKPNICKNTKCNKIIGYDFRNNKFCSKSCSTQFNNLGKIKSKTTKDKISLAVKTKVIPEVDARKTNYDTNPKLCIICGNQLPYANRRKNTCSTECKNELLSLKAIENGNYGGSTKQYLGYCDSYGNFCYLDSYWELVLANSLDKNNIVWTRPAAFKLSSGRRYTPDFYLEDYEVYLDPKAYRTGYIEQVEKIKIFELEYNTKCFVISSFNNLNWEFIKLLIDKN